MEGNFEKEVLHLDNTIKKYEEEISDTRKRIEEIPFRYKKDPIQMSDLMYRARARVNLITQNTEKPYFARIDFEDEKGELTKCYIGKIGVLDKYNNVITIDWRSPFSSIYYDSNVGETSYISPAGVIKGKLNLKRQFNIEERKLLSFQDVDTISNDEMLKPYLNMKADNRLKNIVSTIQFEQNEIIREDIKKNIIVQGVAGSGKTTVALHRVAYLVYNNIEKVSSDEYLVIGPNKFFVNYISNILPDLDTPDVYECTYQDILNKHLKVEFNLISEKDKIKKYINNYEQDNFENYKSSLNIKKDIDKYLDNYINNLEPTNDLEYKDFKLLGHSIILKFYNEENSDVLSKKVNKVIAKISKYIINNNITILLNVREEFFKREITDKKKLLSIEKEIKSGCKNVLKTYFSKFKPKIPILYIDFLQSKYLDEKYINEYIKTVSNIRRKNVELEDMPSLLYLHYKINGVSCFEKYKHTVIDEAQDYGAFNFYVLTKLLPKSTFSIFGDLAQSIYGYRSIENWDGVRKLFDNTNMKQLSKSYRTTIEIMDEANKITTHLNINNAKPVIRHGDKVIYKKIENKIDDYEHILNEYLDLKFKSIAIICKDDEECNCVYLKLKEKGYLLNLIESSDDSYNGGICVIPSYLSKGLEFDGVIVSDASISKFNINSQLDLKLLYVSMTRALHKLIVFYENDLVEVLK